MWTHFFLPTVQVHGGSRKKITKENREAMCPPTVHMQGPGRSTWKAERPLAEPEHCGSPESEPLFLHSLVLSFSLSFPTVSTHFMPCYLTFRLDLIKKAVASLSPVSSFHTASVPDSLCETRPLVEA